MDVMTPGEQLSDRYPDPLFQILDKSFAKYQFAHGGVERLATGTRWGEGPVWLGDARCLLWSDIPNNRILRWDEATGATSVYRQPSDHANGLTRDRQGRLITCEHSGRRVTRTEYDGAITVICDNFGGKKLNSPNDVVVKSDGSVYFTDPMTFNVESDLDFCGVYRVSPDLGSIHLLVRDFVLPNGLCFSPDESILYVNDSRQRHIRAFDVEANGLLALATDRIFCTMTGERPGNPDGMKVDVEGNVYCTGPGGIWILDNLGTHLGTILTAAPVTNIAWGDPTWSTLYITTRHTLARIQLKIPGIPVPRGDLG